jgi:hypothetical protein
VKRFSTGSIILALAAICVAWCAANQLLSAGPSNRAYASSGGDPVYYTLTVTKQQGNGTVRFYLPDVIKTAFPASETYLASAVVSLTANASSGYRFWYWSNLPPSPHTSTENPVSVTMNGDYTVALGKDVRVYFLRQYTLTTTVTGSGTVSPSGGVYDSGASVSLLATASSGWAFDHWEIDLTGITNPKSITMNSNKSVRAVFLPLYTLTVLKTGSGTVTLVPAGGIYKSGVTVNLTATAASGWRFDHWEIDLTGTQQSKTIYMNSNKTVRAVFVNWVILSISTVGQGTVTAYPAFSDWKYTINTDVTLTANAASGWRFDRWEVDLTGTDSPKSITMNTDKSVTAYFIQRVTLMLYQTGQGTISPAIETPHVYDINTNASVSATADTNWRFKEWSGDFSGTSASCNIMMSSDKTVTGTFIRQYLLTTLAGTGGSVSPATGPHDKDSTVTVTPYPSQGWVFHHWELDLSGLDTPGYVLMDSDKTVKAVFKQQRILTVVRQGTGGSVSPAPGTHTYVDETPVTLSASDADGWYFQYWEDALSGSVTPQNLIMNSDKTVTAVFLQKFTLTMSRQGMEGFLNPSVGSHMYIAGAPPVSVSATGTSNWAFDHWEGALTGTATPQNLTMDGNKNVTGVFLPLYTLSTSIQGQGTGSVAPSSGTYKQGTWVQLYATAGAKSWFVEWHGDLSGSANPSSLQMSSNKNVSAEFDTNRLTTSVQGQGSVSPSSGNFGQNEQVSITATPAEGWVFDHWEIDLSGTDSSTSLLMNEDKTVRAVFKELFTLTMAKAPGSATGTVAPAPGEHLYKDGDEATLSATDGATWLFARWTGDLSGNTTPVTVVMDEDKTVTGNFVTIDRIQYNNGTEYADVPNPLYVMKGDSVSFKAIPNPEDATWPQGKPEWGGTSGASGTGGTKSVTFNTVSSSSADYKTVTAECGATRTANVAVVDVEFKSVQFLSDHGTLRQSGSSWLDAGTPYDEPEYTATNNHPISHTNASSITLAFTAKVVPAHTAFKVLGEGSHPYTNFNSSDNEATGSDQSVVMTGDEDTGKLPDVINTLHESIHWKVVLTSPEPDIALAAANSVHTIYLTYGDPYPASDNTEFRLATISGWADGQSTPEGIADAVGPYAVGSDTFNYEYSIYEGSEPWLITPIWEIRETGGDCISQVTFMNAAMQLLGADGGVVGYVTARHNSWFGLWNVTFYPERVANQARLGYVNNNDYNNYEACWLAGGKYWMGGTGTYRSKAVDVLHYVADPNNSDTGNRQCYEDNHEVYVTYPPPPEPTD